MARVSFNSVDLTAYGLTVLGSDKDAQQYVIDAVQLQDHVYTWKGKRQARNIELEVLVSPTAVYPDIHALLSTIRGILDEEEPCKLFLNLLPDRYWLAHFQNMAGRLITPRDWRGLINFYCPDARAYSEIEIVSNHNITPDPATVTETAGGNAIIEPVYLFTAGGALGAITLKIENLTIDEEIQWTGTLAITDTLEVDVEHWMVKKNGVASMSTVTGEFPRLSPGANSIKITGGSTTGTLKITYRNRFI